ncbi:MAG: DUF11 domain-containing protein [Candidatus Sungbacteria bacterium]|uniref:DUF11 domain-containing protein n=1 Tax=Candidatus Sungiibacteriota bacterium TaxID=2750080 RepID=A0A9D6QU32_9BACT|nr:DUF11 domain-containing protein [Candidatus Sungbacteria bacterium]
MGKLDDIRRDLYKNEPERAKDPRFFEVIKSKPEEIKTAWGEVEEAEKIEAPAREKRRRFLRLSVLATLIFAIGVLAVVLLFFYGFARHDLSMALIVKDRIESGERVTYTLSYQNGSRETLKDMQLDFTYPVGASPLREEGAGGNPPHTRITLVDLAPGQKASIEIDARIFGAENDIKTAEASILYRPASSSARFVDKARVNVTIVRVPLVVTLNVPDNLVSRQEVAFTIEYSSDAEAPFENQYLGVEYPAGFQFASADPKPSIDTNIWSIGTLSPGDSGKISIKGIIQGSPAESKPFTAKVGLYNVFAKEWTPYQATTKNAHILVPLLSIEASLNGAHDGVIHAGDDLHAVLHFKNNLDLPLKNISVLASLPSEGIDKSSLLVESGAYDGSSGQVIWNPGSFPQFNSLPAHAEGNLSFSIKTLPNFTSDTRQVSFQVDARIKAADTPVGFEGVDLSAEDVSTAKVSSRLVLSARSLYHNSYLETAGPLPPRVGQTTSYVIVWQLANTTNDLSGVVVRARLAPGVSWENATSPAGNSLSYDSASGAIIWPVGKVQAGAGISKPSPYAAFRVTLTPGENAVSRAVTLASGVNVSANDMFTGELLTVTSEDLTTELKSDALTSDKDWHVVR